MDDRMVWSQQARDALARERGQGDDPAVRALDGAGLRAAIAAVVERLTPAWRRGLPRADAAGQAALATVERGWDPAAVALSAADAAAICSLVGARGSDGAALPYIELVWRERGPAFAVEVLAAMWSLATRYHNPGWPRSDDDLAVWACAIDPSSSSAQDASVSYGKGDVARFLQARHRASTPAEQAAVGAAVERLWPTTPLEFRAALAVAADDRERAEQVVGDLLDGRTTSYPHFAWRTLPHLVGSLDLIDRLQERDLVPYSYHLADTLGVDALPLYQAALARRNLDKSTRRRILELLGVYRGRRSARLVAPYAEKRDYAAAVQAYFAPAPELLGDLLADPELAAHHDRLGKLERRLTRPPAGTARPARRRSPRPRK